MALNTKKKKIRNISNVCSESKEKYSNKNATPEDFKELEKIYDLWIEHKNMKTRRRILGNERKN